MGMRQGLATPKTLRATISGGDRQEPGRMGALFGLVVLS